MTDALEIMAQGIYAFADACGDPTLRLCLRRAAVIHDVFQPDGPADPRMRDLLANYYAAADKAHDKLFAGQPITRDERLAYRNAKRALRKALALLAASPTEGETR
jgi:hypothetical protein